MWIGLDDSSSIMVSFRNVSKSVRLSNALDREARLDHANSKFKFWSMVSTA